ncbi:Small ubiquitin-related modifier [Quillaja saponaria]|uniref:Small ubiquitin-related modifier n=1 Tax=Quillaja saponaria TaxID=32244 RepID=A0AAD7QFI3_QUISA|nr:Small ubiquitin-related modifier [Quillaja saponaria]
MAMATNGGGDEVPSVVLKVKGQDGNEVFFRVKRNTQLFKLMTAYCEKKQLVYKTMQFLYDGDRITGKQTPDRLSMEDGDEITAVMHVNGGGCCNI